MTNQLIEIEVFWDGANYGNQCWAYKTIDESGITTSGPLKSNELHEAVDEACEILGTQGIEQEFELSIKDGGYAIWSQE